MNLLLRSLLTAGFLFSLAGVSSCSKDAAQPAPAQTLVGRWRLTSETSGLTGRTTPSNPAQLQDISFSAAGQMTTRVNGTVVKNEAYALSQRQSFLTNQVETYLTTGPGQMQTPVTIRVDATALTIAIEAYDGPSAHYQRLLWSGSPAY